MKLAKRLNKIEDHFNNLSKDEFEENLIKCGIYTIKDSGMKIVTGDELYKYDTYEISYDDKLDMFDNNDKNRGEAA